MILPRRPSPLRLILAHAILAASIWLGDPASAEPHPRKLEVIALLQARDFAALEAALSKDGRVRDDYKSPFAYSDPALEADLTAWVEASPNAALPYLARGEYYTHIAWLKRGTNYTRHTRAQQFAGMRHYLTLAMRDLNQALARDKGIGMAYAHVFQIALSFSDDVMANRARSDGLAKARNTFPIHQVTIDRMQPIWGATWEERHAYISGLRRRDPDNPDYEFFAGSFNQILAGRLQADGKYDQALEHIDQAIATGDSAGRQSRRAKILMDLERTEEAMKAIDNAIAFAPDEQPYYSTRAEFRHFLGDFDGALKDAEFALALDPYHPDQLLFSAEHRRRQIDRLGEETLVEDRAAFIGAREELLRRALVHGNYEADVHQAWAEHYRSVPESRDQAYKYHLRSIELMPSGPWYWLSFAHTLLRANDCRAVETARRYLNVCAADSDCTPHPIVGVIETNLASCKAPELAGEIELPLAPKLNPELNMLVRCKAYFGQQDDNAAIRACLDLARAGEADAQFDMGMLYIFSGTQLAIRGAEGEHIALASDWLSQALAQNHTGAMAILGNMYLHGIGVAQDPVSALALLGAAAERGHGDAAMGLGLAYHRAIGVPKDVSKAEAYYRRAIELGNDRAGNFLEALNKERG